MFLVWFFIFNIFFYKINVDIFLIKFVNKVVVYIFSLGMCDMKENFFYLWIISKRLFGNLIWNGRG